MFWPNTALPSVRPNFLLGPESTDLFPQWEGEVEIGFICSKKMLGVNMKEKLQIQERSRATSWLWWGRTTLGSGKQDPKLPAVENGIVATAVLSVRWPWEPPNPINPCCPSLLWLGAAGEGRFADPRVRLLGNYQRKWLSVSILILFSRHGIARPLHSSSNALNAPGSSVPQ